MYINTFKYTPKDVSCQLCTEYVKKLGCTALRCPWLAERIEAGVVGYREAVLETFPHERRLFQRLNLLIKHYPGSLWSNEQHERRMQYQCAVQGYRRRRDTNAYYAAMYLLTSNDDIYRRTANCFCKDGIEFGYAVLKNTSPHNYALFMAARDLCDKTEAVTMADLAEPEVIDPEALRLIVNATLIARYTKQAEDIRESIRVLKEKLTEVLENRSERNRWISQFTQFSTLETLDRRALIHMVQSIRVRGKKELDITFTHEDEYKKALQLLALAAQQKDYEQRKVG
ncbi:hypothetical protein JXX18_10845 [Ruthenibacterium lactatiformans]|uniref:hypothetical protein n=1 Tax=Ruthenibacterium lactatiformans TaxID=1550024 RepID=UPI001967DFEC|nr:hypothetical protein [Ruthenibacterium lactatiformans]MBN3016308.1 hypothetical protein [Ruthenibacterium lactatiformans]